MLCFQPESPRMSRLCLLWSIWAFGADGASFKAPIGMQDLPKSMATSNEVIGNLKVFVDNYVEEYEDEEVSWKRSEAVIQKVIDHAMDEQAKEDSIDQKLKQKAAHEKKLSDLANMIRQTDSALKALQHGRGSWMDKFPETKEAVERIYEA